MFKDIWYMSPRCHTYVEAIRVTSRTHIHRGWRSHYIPGMSEESKSLYEAYKKQSMSNPFDSTTLDTGNEANQQDGSGEQEEMGRDDHIN